MIKMELWCIIIKNPLELCVNYFVYIRTSHTMSGIGNLLILKVIKRLLATMI
jgi:hypothetical protein